MNARALKQLVNDWNNEYNEYKRRLLSKQQLIFQVRFNKSQKEEITHSPFHTFRNFSNLHFADKDQILKEIQFFRDGINWYEDKGLSHTLGEFMNISYIKFAGILCHGPPGCGKTSFVKALLTETKRHAVVFSVNKYMNLSVVEKLMRTEIIAGFPIPQHERLYVLEDVDAMEDLVKQRPTIQLNTAKKHQETSDVKQMTLATMTLKDIMLSDIDKPTDNHLAFLLNTLDGVIEVPGRIIVMTTNFPEKLDQALIRPGRIDLKLEFSCCSREVLLQIISEFFERPLDTIDLPDCIQGGLLTPAKVMQLCRANKKSFQNAINAFLNECKAVQDKLQLTKSLSDTDSRETESQ